MPARHANKAMVAYIIFNNNILVDVIFFLNYHGYMTKQSKTGRRDYIIRWREKVGIKSDAELARIAGISLRSVYRFVRGENDGSYETWDKLARVLKKDSDDIRLGPNRWTILDGEKVRTCRKNVDLSVDIIATKLSMTSRDWESAEEGVFRVDKTALNKIASALQAEPHDLLISTGDSRVAIAEDLFVKATPSESTGTVTIIPRNKPEKIEHTPINPLTEISVDQMRRTIQDASWQLNGDLLKHLYESAIMCLKAADAEQQT